MSSSATTMYSPRTTAKTDETRTPRRPASRPAVRAGASGRTAQTRSSPVRSRPTRSAPAVMCHHQSIVCRVAWQRRHFNSPARKPSFRQSVLGFLSGKPATDSLAPVSQRRDSAQSDAALIHRQRCDHGHARLLHAPQRAGRPTSLDQHGRAMTALRAGAARRVLYYFNVHDASPRWLRVKAVLLPSR